ncbi:hypothetical protein GE09DRAFT_1101620 [Coniochaeta sp. 2T2.1]|nr:hypothetical protein GE09DRAFT_1101620 [Coniochaeta sp. 2T2.1]
MLMRSYARWPTGFAAVLDMTRRFVTAADPFYQPVVKASLAVSGWRRFESEHSSDSTPYRRNRSGGELLLKLP